MRLHGLAVALAVVLAPVAAEARCADDLQALQTRVERQAKMTPSAQTTQAAKILKQLNDNEAADEVDCYNALARARRALTAAPKQQAEQQPGAPVAPVAPQQ